jgi:hypothetical protein
MAKRKVKRYNDEGYVTSDDSNAGMKEAYDEGALERANASEAAKAIMDEAKGETTLKNLRDEAAKPKVRAASKPASTPAPATQTNVTDTGDETSRLLKRAPKSELKPQSKVGRAGQASGSSSESSFQDRMAMEYLQKKRDRAAGKDTFGQSQRSRGYFTEKMAKGGSASSRADGIAQRGKTRGKMY